MIAKAINTPEKIRVLQIKLYRAAKAKPDRMFGVLYDKMYRMDILYEAWNRVRLNKGSAGIDKQTIQYIEEQVGVNNLLEDICAQLLRITLNEEVCPDLFKGPNQPVS